MNRKQHEGPGLPVHPPVLYLAGLLIGIALNCARPLALPLSAPWSVSAGVILIVLGLAIMPPVLARFRRHGTPFNAHQPTTALITDGPYRFSRNPAYVALTLWYLGLALVLNNAWALLLTLPLVLLMNRGVIPREERHLEARFGEQYRKYKSRMRRWL